MKNEVKEDEQERKSILTVHLESTHSCQALFSVHIIIHLSLTATHEVDVDHFHFTMMENDAQGHGVGTHWRQGENQDGLGS